MKKRDKKANSHFNFIIKNKILLKSKRSQQIFGLSFEMIFSLILIIFFIVIAFFVINSFLKTKKCAQVGLFIEDLKEDTKDAWNSQSLANKEEYSLPSSLDYACFINFSDSLKGKNHNIGEDIIKYEDTKTNLFLYPIKNACGMPYHAIEHLDMDEITKTDNPYCIKIKNGKLEIDIEKKFNENLVEIR